MILDDVSITHLVYGKEFTSAVEAKQVAQQTAERQEWVVKKAEQEKKAAIIRAEGEAEAAEIITSSLKQCGNGVIDPDDYTPTAASLLVGVDLFSDHLQVEIPFS